MEVRETILRVARELFNARGYQSTTTVQIAKGAEVSERLIFSHFGTKADLFNAAVIAPFATIIGTYVESSVNRGESASLEERIDYLVRGLYDLAREHRTALLTALESTNSATGSPHESALHHLARLLQGTLMLGRDEELRKEFREKFDGQAGLATFVGMVFGVALLDDLVFPPGAVRPSRYRLIEEMRKTTLAGVTRPK